MEQRANLKIAIIGAGAAGLTAAITAKQHNTSLDITLFDSNVSLGKKILASGNGRCNISNVNNGCEHYMGEDVNFASYALEQFNFKAFETFCASLGLVLDIKPDGKVYPLSNEAKSVVNLFESKINALNIKTQYDTVITNISKENEKFVIQSENETFKSFDKVLIASGLQAAPQLRSSEDGLNFAQTFQHSINPTYPSLVGLHVDSNYHHKLQGVKKEVGVSLLINGQKEQTLTGDVLFTKYGVSGFAILDVSQLASYYLSLYQAVDIEINFFPTVNKNELLSKVQTVLGAQTQEYASVVLGGLLPNKLGAVLLEVCGFDKEIKAGEINAKQMRTLVNQLQHWKLEITGTQGYKHAEVSGGGVRVAEVDAKSYESKKVRGLYFAGEVLDITGKRGGYNLHFAWASGYLAGKSLAGK